MSSKLWVGVAILAAFIGGYIVRSCTMPTADEQVAALEKEVWRVTQLVDTLEKNNSALLLANAELDRKNEALEESIAIKEAKISSQSARISELEAQEPSYPELESHPLVINLRAQIAEHKERFSLAQSEITELKLIIKHKDIQYANLKEAYNNRGIAIEETKKAMNDGLITSQKLASENKKLKTWLKIGGTGVVAYTTWKLVIQPLLLR